MIANLAVYFAVHTLFSGTTTAAWGPARLTLPDPASVRPVQLIIAVLAAVMIFRLHWSVLRTLGVCAALGLLAALTPFSLA